MNLLKIKPCDSLFLGTGKQFNFGDNEFIETKYIPYPSVFFGAIFTAFLAKNLDFKNTFFKKGLYDHKNILKIGQIYLYDEKSNTAYIKSPCDLFLYKGNKVFGEFKEIANKSSLSFQRILYTPIDLSDNEICYERAENHFINIRSLYSGYKEKYEKTVEVLSYDEVFSVDTKVGIALNKATRTVEKDKLYKMQQVEFCNRKWSYIVEYELNNKYLKDNYGYSNIRNLEQGYLKLGGEAKACRYSVIENKDIEKFDVEKKKDIETDRFKVIFTSASYFESDLKKLIEEKFKFLGMANHKPIFIGGYDLKKSGGARKMYKGYSAGTVLLLERKSSKINIRSELDSIMNLKDLEGNKGFNKYIIMEES